MTTLAFPRDTAAQPRAIGSVRISARKQGSDSVLQGLRCSGSAKALFPRETSPSLQAVLLNTAGGVTGGDRFRTEATAGPGAALTLSTQTAERAYRAQPGQTGHIAVSLKAGPGARLAWLPQETILFDGSRLARRIDADLAADATLIAVEAIVLGRRAMGERVTDTKLTDQWRVRRDGALIFADALRLTGDAEQHAQRPAILAADAAFASVVVIGPDADRMLDGLRERLGRAGGASLIRPGVLAARLTAPDGYLLRKTLAPVLEYATEAALPKVWTL